MIFDGVEIRFMLRYCVDAIKLFPGGFLAGAEGGIHVDDLV